MRALLLALAGCLLATGARAGRVEVETFVAGHLVRVERHGAGQKLTVGINTHIRNRVLTGPRIEIVAELGGREVAEKIGAPVLVARVLDETACDGATGWRYFVVAIDVVPDRHGPVQACGPVRVEPVPGGVTLTQEGDGGARWRWVPGKGFGRQVRRDEP